MIDQNYLDSVQGTWINGSKYVIIDGLNARVNFDDTVECDTAGEIIVPFSYKDPAVYDCGSYLFLFPAICQ